MCPYRDPNDPRQKISARKYYDTHKAEYLTRNRTKKHAIREWLQEKKKRPCHDCGKRFPHYVMDFDHRSSEHKLYEPTRLYVMQSWKKARAEIAKCDVVCANGRSASDNRIPYKCKRAQRTRFEIGSACWARTSDKLINSGSTSTIEPRILRATSRTPTRSIRAGFQSH